MTSNPLRGSSRPVGPAACGGLAVMLRRLPLVLALVSIALSPGARAEVADTNPAPGAAVSDAERPVLRLADHYQCLPPVMPFAALRKGIAGRTEVAMRVADDGSLAEVVLIAASGTSREHALLDRAALAHVGSCRHAGAEPQPVPGWYRSVIDWRSE